MKENNPKSRAEITLFLLMSVDGKISSGESDILDADWDWKRIHGVKEGLPQYYQIEQTTDLHSLITGKVLTKLGANEREIPKTRPESSLFLNSIVIDRKPWLTAHGVRSIANGVENLYLVTNNTSHPAHDLQAEIDNLTVISYQEEIDFQDLFQRMKQEHGADRITIQSGGMLNAALVCNGLIDHLIIVIAPLLVGGKATPTLIDGHSFQTEAELMGIKALKLTKCEALKDSYIRLEYDVIQNTIIDSR
ncbi:MAG: dihydrofolate reductase family protein [Candidatus Heimdallarchaeota archaeon]|nr:dihydrofolate reductase family protein [Candidatus Heimdallarchaeota archaeon]